LAVLAALALLGGCREAEPARMSLSFGSYAASPAILLSAQVNGRSGPWQGMLVASRADQASPRGGGIVATDYPPAAEPGQVVVAMEWVEVFTGKAWAAELRAPVAALDRLAALDSVTLTPIIGPNGLLVLGSDPVPATADAVRPVDVARICGHRLPPRDSDYTRTPGAVAGLPELLARPRPSPTDTAAPAFECPAQD
jgi:hypothetical protein